MANVRSANTFYIDGTATNLAVEGIKVTHVIVTATSANAILGLQDITGTVNKVNLRVATPGETQVFDFSDNPIVFASGILPSTVTNCVATLLIVEGRG